MSAHLPQTREDWFARGVLDASEGKDSPPYGINSVLDRAEYRRGHKEECARRLPPLTPFCMERRGQDYCVMADSQAIGGDTPLTYDQACQIILHSRTHDNLVKALEDGLSLAPNPSENGGSSHDCAVYRWRQQAEAALKKAKGSV